MTKVISKDGTSIFYEKSGSGLPLILVDGAMCSLNLGPMRPLVALLAESFTVYAYDRRGRGGSGDMLPYAVNKEIEDIDALITEAGDEALVFGMSSGAALALKAAKKGLNIKKIALYEPPFMVSATGHRPPADHQDQLVKMIGEGRKSDAIKFFLLKVIGMPTFVVFIMRWLPVWSKIKAVANTLPYDSAIMGDFNLPINEVSAIRIPTIVIGGAKSPEVLRNAVAETASAIPNSELKFLDGQKHNVAVKALAPVLKDFFLQAETVVFKKVVNSN